MIKLPNPLKVGVTSTDWQSRYDKLEASDLPDNVIQLIGKRMDACNGR